ncbi:MAG: anhydro-N-acetylmuramic acid kinase [Cyanobacteria bacterium P01_A01_bin.84]
MTRVIGLMSGTSVDGIDAALVDIDGEDLDINVELIAGITYPYPPELREKILAVCCGASISMAEFAELDNAIAFAFAQAAQSIQSHHQPAILIGSHGQTVYHQPPQTQILNQEININNNNQNQNQNQNQNHNNFSTGYSLQLGRGAIIANITGLTTINNFRVADIAAGGHGAPLVPRPDAALLSHPELGSCIQNIGGIGNVTYIPARRRNWLEKICGWDTGPGNSLLDLAVEHLTSGEKKYDNAGEWAASGSPCHQLVKHWLEHEYFQLSPPKSTGRELFGTQYLQNCLQDAQEYQLSSADFLATLTELTAASIVHSYRNFLPQMPERVLICGGGTRNIYLKNRLQTLLDPIPVITTDEVGLNSDFKEAIAFAILAYWRYSENPGNLPAATGASQEVLLGEIHVPKLQGVLSIA